MFIAPIIYLLTGVVKQYKCTNCRYLFIGVLLFAAYEDIDGHVCNGEEDVSVTIMLAHFKKMCVFLKENSHFQLALRLFVSTTASVTCTLHMRTMASDMQQNVRSLVLLFVMCMKQAS